MSEHKLLREILYPLQLAAGSPVSFDAFLRRCGLDTKSLTGDLAGVASSISQLLASVESQPVSAIVELLHSVRELLTTLVADPEALGASTIELVERIVGGTLAEYLTRAHPAVLALLLALGLIDCERGWRLDPERVIGYLSGTDDLRGLYHWGVSDEEFRWKLVYQVVFLLLSAVQVEGRLERIPMAAKSLYSPEVDLHRFASLYIAIARSRDWQSRVGISLMPIPEQPAQTDRVAGLWVGLGLSGAANATLPIQTGWSLNFAAAVDSNQSLGMLMLPSGLRPAQTNASASLGVELRGAPERPWQILGEFLTVHGAKLGFQAELAAAAIPTLGFSFGTTSMNGAKGVVLAIRPAEGDSFLRALVGDKPLEIGFDIDARWSMKDGLRISGGVSGAIELSEERQIGPLKFSRTRIAISGQAGNGADRGGLSIAGSTCIGAELGPLDARIDEMGLALIVTTCEQGDGLLGRVDVRLGFKPPKGVGFSIESETVKGGGFLSFDFDAGRYAGVLELVTPSFGLTALGILTTKIPGEPKGWSLFFALTATFNPGIQLGFGFVLTGVGGLFAVNRRLDEPAMRAAVRGGNLDSVLFPTDVVAEAPRIFATVESMFPIAKGSFVFGPMIKIGWGSPTLVEAMIGIFVSLPAPLIIALLGRVRLALPADKPILVLNMDIAGSINFGAGTVGLDAQIHDSTLWKLELTGSMAFRARFKDQPGFLLSVGGFHPAFEPPADVGPLARMGMSLRLGKQENILVSLRSYFALTSNTLQFGAAIEVSAQILKFRIYGGAYFDALIVYRPFHFTAGMGAYFGVAWRKWELLAVRVALTLDGPGPWRARGVASFTIVGFELSFEFDETFGDKLAESEERAPVRAPLIAALAEPGNWGAAAGGFDSLRLRDLPPGSIDATHIVVAPGDRLLFRQRVAPLAVTLEQMGPVEPQERGPFAVQVLKLGARMPDPGAVAEVDELFAPAAYFDMTDAERLGAPSFEPMTAGVAVGADWQAPAKARRTTVVDGMFESIGGLWPENTDTAPDAKSSQFAALHRGDPDTWKRRREPVTVAPPCFVRASGDSLAAIDEARSWHAARAQRAAGERILPAHAARKTGR